MVAVTALFVTFWQWPICLSSNDSLKFDPRDGLLPLFLVEHDGREERFYSEKERLEYFAAHNLAIDAELETPIKFRAGFGSYGNRVCEKCYGYSYSLKPLCA